MQDRNCPNCALNFTIGGSLSTFLLFAQGFTYRRKHVRYKLTPGG